MSLPVIIKPLRFADYQTVWQEMRDFTDQRTTDTFDEIWLIEHPPVFTQGQAGKAEHILDAGDIPIVQTDRGGQVTYHGPGQLVVYFLIDVRRRKFTIRKLVSSLENAVVAFLQQHNITASGRPDAPGVYVEDAKICSIGLRIRRGCSYHGIAFNIDMDLTPFTRINPCGFHQLRMTQLSNFIGPTTLSAITDDLVKHLQNQLAFQPNLTMSEE